MNVRNLTRRSAWLLLPAFTLALDYLSKAWILARFSLGGDVRPITIIPGFFNLTLGMNSGAIFGFLRNTPESFRIPFFAVVGILALGFFGYEFLKEGTTTIQRVALGLIIGGAIGNGYDRVIRKAVVDFLDFVFWGWQYPTFNLADSAIVCGAILLGWSMIRSPKKA